MEYFGIYVVFWYVWSILVCMEYFGIYVGFWYLCRIFVCMEYFFTFSAMQTDFLNIYIFMILFQNILIFNKKILNLEQHYASYYLTDIFIYSVNIISLLWFNDGDIELIAYVMVVSTAIATLWQFYLLFKKLSISYSLQFHHSKIKEIIKNSIKMKVSSMLYQLKDPLFAMIFLSLGEGVFSLYNYAYKFSAAIFQVTNTPIMNRYMTQVNYSIAQKNYDEIKFLIKKVLLSSISFFIIATTIFYFIMPLFLELTFGNKLESESVYMMQTLFIYISLLYLVIVVESPYANNIGIFKLFNYNIFVNGIFALFILFIYLLFKFSYMSYTEYLIILIIAQFFNLLLFFYKNVFYIKSKLME